MTKTPREVLEKYEYDIQHFDCRKKYYKVKYDGEIDNLWTKMLKDLEALIPKKKEEYETCTRCGGLGRIRNIPHRISRNCHKCNGRGKIVREDYKYCNQVLDQLHKLYKE